MSDDSTGKPIKAVAVHWGWVTPGVADCNRRMQEDEYLAFLEAERDTGDCFNFTQPGWVLDARLDESVLHLTRDNPEPGKQGRPFGTDTMDTLKQAVADGRLTFLAYPYSGAVVEGMTGETVLKSLRLSREVARANLDTRPVGYFVHDGLNKLDWNVFTIPQIGLLAGYDRLFGRQSVTVESPDGTVMPMLGRSDSKKVVFHSVELMNAAEQVAELRGEYGADKLGFVSARRLVSLVSDDLAKTVSCNQPRTKGWYGGAPLVMQMQAALRRADRKLAVLVMLESLLGRATDPDNLWKRSLVMQDCHLQWLLHDLAPHHLPEARALEQEVTGRIGALVEASDDDDASHLFNPLPFERSAVVWLGDSYRLAEALPPCGTIDIETTTEAEVTVTERMLSNSRIRVSLDERGTITDVFGTGGTAIYTGQASRLVRRHNAPAEGQIELATGTAWTEGEFSGNLELTAELKVPEAGDYTFSLDVPRGMTIAVESGAGHWVPATNLHWGGGLPGENRDPENTGRGSIYLDEGKQVLKLYAVADRGYHIASATLTSPSKKKIKLKTWTGRLVSRWCEDPFEIDRVETRPEGARASVVYHGHFKTCTARLEVSLEENQSRVDYRLVRHYDEPTFEGLETRPLPMHIGSYLGSTCERPYVPAFAVESGVVFERTEYLSDKPFGYARAVDNGEAWFTGRFTEIYDGMAPVLGIDTAVARWPEGAVMMLTDGHGHFYRKRNPEQQTEQLGLSLGATVIHPMTQSYKMDPDSQWDRIGRHFGTDYADAFDRYDFVCPRGDIEVSWSMIFDEDAVTDWRELTWQRLARIVPPVRCRQEVEPLVKLRGKRVALTGIETVDGQHLVRLVNLVDHEEPFELELPWPTVNAQVARQMPSATIRASGRTISGVLPPYSVREIVIPFE